MHSNVTLHIIYVFYVLTTVLLLEMYIMGDVQSYDHLIFKIIALGLKIQLYINELFCFQKD